MLDMFAFHRAPSDPPTDTPKRFADRFRHASLRRLSGAAGLLAAGIFGLCPFSFPFSQASSAATLPSVSQAASAISSAPASVATSLPTSVGSLAANIAGRRMHFLSFAQVKALTARGERGAAINSSANTVTYTGRKVTLVFLADPASLHLTTPKWQLDGLLNPTVTVPRGAHVAIDFINADKGAPSPMMQQMHGFYVTATPPPFAMFPLTEAFPVPGTLLGDLPPQQPFWSPTGMMMRSEPFRAPSGTYYYLCPDMGHAQMGMWGKLIVSSRA